MNDQRLLEKLAQNVLLKSGMVTTPGLAYGKMGMVLFLMHYARYTRRDLYEEYAEILLDEMYSHLDVSLPVNMESGLCGIGWGTEYLLQNHFVEGDADEILEEIDQVIMERNPVRVTDLSLETGLSGIFEYALIRLRSGHTSGQRKVFDSDYQEALFSAARKLLENTEEMDYRERAELLINGIKDPERIPERKIFDVVRIVAPEEENLWQRSDGLKNGNSGVGLKMILG